MGWGAVVHENRRRAELQRARSEAPARRRGYALEARPDAELPALLTLGAALSAALWARHEARSPAGPRWRRLPGAASLLALLNGPHTRSAPTAARGKPRAAGTSSSAAGAHGAARAAALRSGAAASGRGASGTPATTAAANAALQRQQAAAAPTAGARAAGGGSRAAGGGGEGGGGGGGKKKTKKKR
jgi:hypothetical protein